MVFGGIQKTSLMDFPGRVSCILFTAGCNFKCPYCHNPELLKSTPEHPVPEDEILTFLKERAGFLDGVVITGGEPTLHSDLGDFCGKIRAMGYALKLDTNGSKPDVLKNIVDNNLVDYVAMDIKTLPENYSQFVHAPCEPQDITESISLIINSGIDHEFRTTCAWPMVSIKTIKAMGGILNGARKWAFQLCGPERMLKPGFLKNARTLYGKSNLEEFARAAGIHVKECIIRA